MLEQNWQGAFRDRSVPYNQHFSFKFHLFCLLSVKVAMKIKKLPVPVRRTGTGSRKNVLFFTFFLCSQALKTARQAAALNVSLIHK
jgi:hypothetical protein